MENLHIGNKSQQDGPNLESSSYLNKTLRYLGTLGAWNPWTFGPWELLTLGHWDLFPPQPPGLVWGCVSDDTHPHTKPPMLFHSKRFGWVVGGDISILATSSRSRTLRNWR